MTSAPPAAEVDQLAALRPMLQRQRGAFLAAGPPPAAVRRHRIDRLMALVLDNAAELADALHADFGTRPHTASVFSDVLGPLTDIGHTRSRLARWMRAAHPAPVRRVVGLRTRVVPQPLGVVGILGPWNFPIALVVQPAAAALAAGNRVMIKMSEVTPQAAELFRRRSAEYFEPEELAVFIGGPDLGAAFSSLPLDHLFFTGSAEVGRLVQRAASANLVPVTLELGGKNPAVVAADADLRRAAERIAAARMVNGGQLCLCPDDVFVPADRLEQFVSALLDAFGRMFPAIVDSDQYCSMVDAGHFERVRGLVDDARAKGARVDAAVPADEALPDPVSRKIAPTVVRDVTDAMDIDRHEIFGPVLAVHGYQSVSDVIERLARRPAPLVAYWYGRDSAGFRRFVERTRSGSVARNDLGLGAMVNAAPFGGIGHSGMGAYHGRAGFDTFSHHRTVIGSSLPISLAKLSSPPFSEGFSRRIDTFLALQRRTVARRLRRAARRRRLSRET